MSMDAVERGLASQGSARDIVELWATRYELPALPDSYVHRPRLQSILDSSGHAPLVLISAAAGAGKTLVVAEWVRRSSDDTVNVWVRFDSGEAGSFWPTVVCGLARSGLELSSDTTGDDGAGRDGDLVRLCAALVKHSTAMRLVLDDFDLMSPQLASDLDFVLRHAKGALQVVITTRMDPVLPLYRYRLEDQVVEVRTADLAFTPDESASLLQACGVRLASDSVRALHARTEGWAAGLRFAAMFLADCADPDAAARAVSGDSGNIAEYLIGEVLKSQDSRMRQLLLNTSVADTLQPGLIEELGGPNARRELALLAKENTFIDQRREAPGTYTYHPLFKDLLQAELSYEAPSQWQLMHRKAAAWFARHGMIAPSVAHAATANAWDDAARFIVDELAVGQLLLERGSGELTSTFQAMPRDLTDASSCIVRAALALARGLGSECDSELDRAQESISRGDTPAAHGGLQFAISFLAAVRASSGNDSEAARRLAEAAEGLLLRSEYQPKLETHPELAALVHTSRGIAAIRAGRLTDAVDAFSAGESAAKAPGCEALLAECRGFLALVTALRGRLTRADAQAARSIAASDSSNTPPAERPPSALVARAWVGLERYDLMAAAEYLGRARQSRFLARDPVSRTMAAVAASRLQRAHGDLSAAIAVAERATEQVKHGSWLDERLRIEIASVLVATGELEAAENDLTELRAPANEAEIALATAQTQLERGSLTGIDASLGQATNRAASLSTRIAGGLVQLEQGLLVGDTRQARNALERSLRLAAPEVLRRPFREASPAVKQLMHRNPDLLARHTWLDQESARVGHSSIPGQQAKAPRAGHDPELEPQIVEPLTGKEMEVLGHLAELLSTDEIAETMFVSSNTIRTHVRSILRKLGVSRRNEAVRRARKLSLINV